MGRLRTAVHNFSALDLPPDELLGHLDELVGRIDQDEAGTTTAAPASPAPPACTRSTTRSPGAAPMARAGHPPPALVRPDGTRGVPRRARRPPLGLGGLPFETAELELPEGSRLVLYTDGLVEDRDRDIDAGLELLRQRPGRHAGPDAGGDLPGRARRAAARPARATTSRCSSPAPALLAADQVADVGRARPTRPPSPGSAPRSPGSWPSGGWTELAFTTELILSELVTNAIRYGTGAHPGPAAAATAP